MMGGKKRVGSTGHIKGIILLPFPYQRKVYTENLLCRHALQSMLGRTLIENIKLVRLGSPGPFSASLRLLPVENPMLLNLPHSPPKSLGTGYVYRARPCLRLTMFLIVRPLSSINVTVDCVYRSSHAFFLSCFVPFLPEGLPLLRSFQDWHDFDVLQCASFRIICGCYDNLLVRYISRGACARAPGLCACAMVGCRIK